MFETTIVANMTSPLNLKKLMQSLIDLTKVRDSLALDPALLSLMQQWMSLFATQAQPVRMQVLSKRQLVSVMDTKE